MIRHHSEKDMLIINKTALVATSLAMVMVIASGASWAGPIVTAWDYVTNTIFTDAEFTDKGPYFPFGPEFNTTFRGTPIKTDDELSWGRDVGNGGSFYSTSGDRSAVTIGSGITGDLTGGGPVSGSVNTIFGNAPPTTASEIGIGVNISHWNNPIGESYDELLSGTLLDTLTLTPIDGRPFINLPPLVFNFVFNETLNEPVSGTCAGETAPLCGDLFGILGLPDLNPGFEYDGRNYQANILLLDVAGGVAPIGMLLDGECEALELDNGCLGWRTDEGKITTKQFAFTIRSIPEPSTLALFGLGLAGLGYRRYKTRAA